MATELTPMMRQYMEMKARNKDCILFFRLGDFYEMFMDDAKVASKELDLTLTTRDRNKDKEDQVPMCGVPYHSVEAYIGRLVAKGYKVAICEQTEDPAQAKGLVGRDIIRIVTPGTLTSSSMLDERKNNYMGCVYGKDGSYGLCFCDVSTGAFYATSAQGEEGFNRTEAELGRFAPVEVLVGGPAVDGLRVTLYQKLRCSVDESKPELFQEEEASKTLEAHFSSSLADLGVAGQPCLIIACGALLRFLRNNQKSDLDHIRTLELYSTGKFMELDLSARRNLELTETLQDQSKKGSLLWVLDKTKTSMGGRLLRSWVEKPLLDPTEIRRRQEAVAELVENPVLRGSLTDCLKEITDLERTMARIVTGSANCRDLLSLAQGCVPLPELKKQMEELKSPHLRKLTERIDVIRDCRSLILRAVVDEPPFTVREGGMIRDGADPEIDRLKKILNGGVDIVRDIENRERERTGIRTLKVGYNRVFGYYIEVSKSFQKQVPKDYIRKQTLANCERYITQEVKELESTILSAKDQIMALEYQLFVRIRDFVALQSGRVQGTAAAVAEVDVLCSLASVAALQGYCCPEITTGPEIVIKDGRHPVVEQVLADSLFVPNDTNLGGVGNQVAILTGPNMAGKSTYMRQVALIVIMAQMGSFVPAKSARIGIVDRVFTRIGASDDLSSGRSTFMVEMSEVAGILKYATARSLLILDEIGRGTSTYDGMAIARAVLEYAANTRKLGAKTLFATHYHELSEIEGELANVKNYNIAVKKRKNEMIFLRKIVPGAADQSYGVEVANLAGLPASVIGRARQLLKELEAGNPRTVRREAPATDQVSMLDLSAQAVADELRSITVETLTPIEAMNVLFKLKQML